MQELAHQSSLSKPPAQPPHIRRGVGIGLLLAVGLVALTGYAALLGPTTVTRPETATVAIDGDLYNSSSTSPVKLRLGFHQFLTCLPGSLCESKRVFVWPYLTRTVAIKPAQVKRFELPRIATAQQLGDRFVIVLNDSWTVYEGQTADDIAEMVAKTNAQDLDKNVDDLSFLTDYEGNSDPYDFTVTPTTLLCLRQVESGSVLIMYDRLHDEIRTTIANVTTYAVVDDTVYYAIGQGVYAAALDAPAAGAMIGSWPANIVGIAADSEGFLISAQAAEEEQVLTRTDRTLKAEKELARGALSPIRQSRAEPFLAWYKQLHDGRYETLLVKTGQGVELIPLDEATEPFPTSSGYSYARYSRMNNQSSLPFITEIVRADGEIEVRLAGEHEVQGVLQSSAGTLIVMPNALVEVPDV